MASKTKIVSRIPVENVWDNERVYSAVRGKYLDESEIKELLETSPVQFVVANIGFEMKWIPKSECYDFWKKEVQLHLPKDNDAFELSEFPGHYAYVASQWKDESETPIVLLEKYH